LLPSKAGKVVAFSPAWPSSPEPVKMIKCLLFSELATLPFTTKVLTVLREPVPLSSSTGLAELGFLESEDLGS
jgi:hypothetical protein